jgi:hypothetical protein
MGYLSSLGAAVASRVVGGSYFRGAELFLFDSLDCHIVADELGGGTLTAQHQNTS